MNDRLKLDTSKLNLTVDARILRHIEILEALVDLRDAGAIREATKGLTPDRQGNLLDIPGISLGKNAGGRRIGGQPGASKDNLGLNGVSGFKDPLAGKTGNRPRGMVVGPGGFPSSGDVTGQDAGSSTHYDGGQRMGMVWLERHTSRNSADGTQTWGSNLYRDTGGNSWRVDYHDRLNGVGTPEDVSDDTFSSKETVFNEQNEPVSTAVREAQPDGTAKETTTDHRTGETTTRTGTVVEIFPDRSQTAEGTGRGDSVAPRGWSNPISGGTHNPGLATDNNQVNPGREDNSTQPAQPLILDPKDLVINPPLYEDQANGTLRDIRREHDDINQVDPPRPISNK